MRPPQAVGVELLALLLPELLLPELLLPELLLPELLLPELLLLELLSPPELPSLPELLSLPVAGELDSEEDLSPAIFFLSPDLKSVSYQPPPFNRKAAAETFFFKADSPQEGHSCKGSSLIFCSTSSP